MHSSRGDIAPVVAGKSAKAEAAMNHASFLRAVQSTTMKPYVSSGWLRRDTEIMAMRGQEVEVSWLTLMYY